MASRYKITYDSSKERAFLVHVDGKPVRFEETASGLYVCKPCNDAGITMVTTIEENKTFHTPRQFDQAKKARNPYHAICTPSIPDFKSVLRMNLIKNCPITTKDIDIAEKIFGQAISAIKGKTTRTTPTPVVIPPELVAAQKDVILCIDVIKVNGLHFLATISKNLFYRTAQYVQSHTSATYHKSLQSVFAAYKLGGFCVSKIRCDNEFRPLTDELANKYTIRMNYSNAGEHVPEAERNNRVIKERCRATYHRLPFNQLSRLMVKVLVAESAKKLNFFPAKHGISRYYSPRMMLHQKNLDYDKHCKYAFGTYVQGHDDKNPRNANISRTLDYLYLRYNDSHQGGHELFHLLTDRIITRRYVTAIPISQVHKMQLIKTCREVSKLKIKLEHYFMTVPGLQEWILMKNTSMTTTMKKAIRKASSGKRTRHFHIKYFYIIDLIQRNEIQIEYCPTDDMIGDYLTKPLTGAKFTRFRNKIMGVG